MINQGHDTTMMRHWATMPPEAWFDSLEDLTRAAKEKRDLSRSMNCDWKDLEFAAQEDNVVLTHRGANYPVLPNAYAFGQLCTQLQAPAAFLRDLSAETAVLALNEKRRKLDLDEKSTKLLMTRNGGRIEARAATGPKYGRIWNHQVAELAAKLNDAAGGTLYNPPCWDGRKGGLWLNDARIVLFFIDGGSIVDGGGERDQLHRGYYMWNSEVGDATWFLDVFLFRAVCGNLQIWGKDSFLQVKVRHTHGAPIKFDGMEIPNLRDHFESSTGETVELIKKAKAYELPTERPKLVDMFANRGFTRSFIGDAIALAEEEEGQCATLWDMQQGMTAAARQLPTAQQRFDISRQAGTKLMAMVA
jgi:hypothetical protein